MSYGKSCGKEMTKIIKLKDALDFLRGGQCNDEVEQYLQSLARDLDSVDMLSEIHIYFKKLSVEIHTFRLGNNKN